MHKIKSQEENKMLWQIEKNAINEYNCLEKIALCYRKKWKGMIL